MTGLDGAEYVLANLEGLARREILSLPASDITSTQEICDAIVTAFAERRSAAQLRDALHARPQATSETIREFRHSLFRIVERLQSKLHDTPAMPKCDFNARFVEGLRNKSIRKRMCASLADADRTDDDFKIVRDKAVQFEREEEEDEDDAEGKHVSSCQQSSVTDLQQDDAEGKHVSSCQQSSVTDLQQDDAEGKHVSSCQQSSVTDLQQDDAEGKHVSSCQQSSVTDLQQDDAEGKHVSSCQQSSVTDLQQDDAEGKHVSSCQQSSVTDLQQQITALVETVAQLSVNMATMNKKLDERVPTDQNIDGSQHQFDRAYEQRGDDRQRSGRYTQQRRSKRQSNSRDRCYGCGKFGHFRRDCTQLVNEQSLEQPMTNRYSGNDRPPL